MHLIVIVVGLVILVTMCSFVHAMSEYCTTHLHRPNQFYCDVLKECTNIIQQMKPMMFSYSVFYKSGSILHAVVADRVNSVTNQLTSSITQSVFEATLFYQRYSEGSVSYIVPDTATSWAVLAVDGPLHVKMASYSRTISEASIVVSKHRDEALVLTGKKFVLFLLRPMSVKNCT
jgi:hypothetical protein